MRAIDLRLLLAVMHLLEQRSFRAVYDYDIDDYCYVCWIGLNSV